MTESSKRKIVALIAISIALIVLARYNYLANIIIHTLVDVFAGGRSSVKVNLFFVYLIFLSLIGFCLINVSYRQLQIKLRWLWVAVSVAFIYNFSLLLIFYQKWNVNPRNFVVIFNNNEITSTMILHNHLMKGFNGWLLSWFGAAHQENLDTGYALISLLPSLFYVVGGLMFVIVAILLILKFVELFRRQSSSHVLFIVLYSIVSFSLLKNLLDGGILNRETPIALSGLIALLWLNEFLVNEKKKIVNGIILSLSPLVCYGLIVVFLWQTNLIPIDLFLPTSFPIILFGVLLVNLIWWWRSGIKADSRIGAVLLFPLIILLYFPVSNSIYTFLNSQNLVSKQGVWVALYRPPNVANNMEQWEAVEKINDLNIYRFRPKQPTKIADLLESNNLVGNYSPISIEGYGCLLLNQKQQVYFTLKTTHPLQPISDEFKFGKLLSAELQNNNNGLYEYKMVGELNSCAPRKLNILRELLYLQGQEPYLITNIHSSYGNIE